MLHRNISNSQKVACGNYVQAVEEFQVQLSLYKQHLEAHDWPPAVTHYLLELVYGYNSQYDQTVAQFSQCTDAIEKKMALLYKQMEEVEGPTT